jgi:glycosyltransferase involved in cell wall biosynthesis
VVLASDVEVLVFALIRALLPWSGPTIVLQGFIYTSRNHQLINRLRWFYYSFVLARCDCVICHSQIEISRYRVLFPRCAAKFAFVTWAAHVEGYEQAIADDPHDSGFHVLAAGRSGRDYKTLAAAVAGTGIEVTVICDSLAGLGGVSEDAQFRIRRDCYGQDYLAELRRSDVVVVPLAVDNISAGQMVMIQAMAYGRPLIVTDTPTVREYLNDGVEGLLVPRADPPKLAAALMRLRNDPALRQLLGAGGRAAYLARFSQRALLQGVVDAVAQARSPRL